MPPGPHYRGNIYSALKDVLQRIPEIDGSRVYYRPSSAHNRYLEAYINPERIDLPAGPDTPKSRSSRHNNHHRMSSGSTTQIQTFSSTVAGIRMRIILNTERCIFSMTTPVLMSQFTEQSLLGQRRRLGSYGRYSITSSLKSFSRSQHPSIAKGPYYFQLIVLY